MTRRNTEQQRARELQKAEGIGYHDALSRIRELDQAPKPSTITLESQPATDRGAMTQVDCHEDVEEHTLPRDTPIYQTLRYADELLGAGDEVWNEYSLTSRFSGPGLARSKDPRRAVLGAVAQSLVYPDRHVFVTDGAVTVRYSNGHSQRFTPVTDGGFEEHTLPADAAVE
ncbi:hypothetical protein AB0D49_32855 [Streptomyces sp. NPDC048290]|uniref:hypothetical protein n=1 Tax=Streptomyces sp. NPDC048290 TaxID=3155811 RepID=UPI003421CA4A